MVQNDLMMTDTQMPSRTLPQITASAKLHVQGAGQNLLELGQDMLDAKVLLGHGKWMPWLKEIGQSARTAENLMRLAREVQPGSAMASLPYTKALAMLALPKSERESFAAANEDKSAAEIKRLIMERDQLKRERDTANIAYERAHQEAEQLRANPPVQKIIEVPDDYQALKAAANRHEHDLDEAEKAVEEAERRAEIAEARARQLEAKAGGSAPDPVHDAWNCWNDMMMIANTWAYQPQLLGRERTRMMKLMEEVRRWVLDMQKALDNSEWAEAEGAVL